MHSGAKKAGTTNEEYCVFDRSYIGNRYREYRGACGHCHTAARADVGVPGGRRHCRDRNHETHETQIGIFQTAPVNRETGARKTVWTGLSQ